MTITEESCAGDLLEVIPLVMQFVRAEMRSRRSQGLSVPQFRALLYLARHPGASLRELATHLGLTPPTTSTLIDALVDNGMAKREASPVDRRMITITVTEKGRRSLDGASKGTRQRLADVLERLEQAELSSIKDAMTALRRAFAAEEKQQQQ